MSLLQSDCQALREFLRRYGWLWALLVVTLFAFPMKLGLKTDPALFASIARKVIATGQWWPLEFQPGFLTPYYNHPPGVIWAMAFLMRASPQASWAVPLLSRLSVLLTYLLLSAVVLRISSFQKKSKEEMWARAAFALIFTHTWVTWLKYVADAQREGPFTLSLALFLFAAVAWTFTSQVQKKNEASEQKFGYGSCILWFVAFAAGIWGFLTKPEFFAIFVAGWSAWCVLTQRWRALSIAFPAFLGWCVGLGVMCGLDHWAQTRWVSFYFREQLLGHAIEGKGLAAPLSLNPLRLWRALTDFVDVQIRYAVIWTLPFWVACVWAVWKKRLKEPLLGLSFVLYWVFMAPIIAAAFKIAHYPVPAYPIGALFLAGFVPVSWTRGLSNFSTSSKSIALSTAMISLFAILPYKRISNELRGEEWSFHREMIQKNTSPEQPLLIYVAEDHDYLWNAYVYSAYWLGLDHPMRFPKAHEVLNQPCSGGILMVPERDATLRSLELRAQGWLPTHAQTQRVVAFYCQR